MADYRVGKVAPNKETPKSVALNSITNRATDKLADIFENKPPSIRPQAEMITPEGVRVRTTQPTPTAEAITEMRGRGGYESNELYDRVGTKMPRVRQPLEVTPSSKPNALNKPLGTAEKIPTKAAPENIRGLTRQNEAAETLAKNGYHVEQKPQLTETDRMSNPWLNKNKKPDFKVEGEIFDAYSPNKSTDVKNIRDHIEDKVIEGQSRRVVLNLDDSPIHLDDLRKTILEKPVLELQQILTIKDGKAINFFPFDN